MNKNYPLNKVKKFSSIKEMLSLAEKEAGEKIAFQYKTGNDKITSVTYNEFVRDTRALGTALVSKGIKNCHISCIGENSYSWVTAYLTVLCSSSVFVPIDKDLPADDILNVINSSDSEVIFYAKKYEKLFMENRNKIPNIRLFIGFGREEDEGDFISFEKFKQHGEKLLSEGSVEFLNEKSDEYALKLLVYTSGTTGMAKGVMLSEHNLVSCVYYGLQVSTIYDKCLSVLPYHHTYESVCGILVSLHFHSTICINESLLAVLKNLQLYKPSYILLVPAFAEMFYKKILAAAEESGKSESIKKAIALSNKLRKVGIDIRKILFKKIHASFGGRLKKIVCGGAPIRPEIGKFFDDIGINLINGYGITECSPLVSANRDKFNDCKTAGVLLPCVKVKIDNLGEDGNGEICVKGDTVMLGYYKDPEQTSRVLRDGWFHTGDLGNVNEFGQLSITGRIKNLIILRNGKNIYPEEIENCIMSIPYVSEVVVYEYKEKNGLRGVLCAEAFLNKDIIRDLKVPVTLEMFKEDVRTVCSALPSYKQISKFILRDKEFEKTTSRKIKRNYA